MEDNNNDNLSLMPTPEELREIGGLEEHIIRMDEELEGHVGMRWARKRLFKLYNLCFNLNVDEYCPPLRKQRRKKRKEVVA